MRRKGNGEKAPDEGRCYAALGRKGNGENAPDEGRSYAALGRKGMERLTQERIGVGI